MDPDSLSSKYMEREDYEKVTPTNLYKSYKKIIENSICDIYVIGDMDMDEVAQKIKKYFNLKMVKNHELELYTENKKRKKVKVVKEAASLGCTQTSKSCPIWMYNYLQKSTEYGGTINDNTIENGADINYGYWTMNADSTYDTHAWLIPYGGFMGYDYSYNIEHGARAVVVVNK